MTKSINQLRQIQLGFDMAYPFHLQASLAKKAEIDELLQELWAYENISIENRIDFGDYDVIETLELEKNQKTSVLELKYDAANKEFVTLRNLGLRKLIERYDMDGKLVGSTETTEWMNMFELTADGKKMVCTYDDDLIVFDLTDRFDPKILARIKCDERDVFAYISDFKILRNDSFFLSYRSIQGLIIRINCR